MSAPHAFVYEGLAEAWAAGPAAMYQRLAEAIVDVFPGKLDGLRVLDVGAGTGAATHVLAARGGQVTALELSRDMVEHMRAEGISAVRGDMCAMPFEAHAFDAALAAFAISHVEDPVVPLREMARVVRAQGPVVAAVFGRQTVNASKDAVDAVAARYGYARPSWYAHFKDVLEARCSSPEALSDLAEAAGLTDVCTVTLAVDTGVDDPEAIVATRIGMAHLAPFVAELSAEQRARFVADAVAAVRAVAEPLRPPVLVMTGRVAAVS